MSDQSTLHVTCANCGIKTSVEEVNNLHTSVSYLEEPDHCLTFGSMATQDKIDALALICESCADDIKDENDY